MPPCCGEVHRLDFGFLLIFSPAFSPSSLLPSAFYPTPPSPGPSTFPSFSSRSASAWDFVAVRLIFFLRVSPHKSSSSLRGSPWLAVEMTFSPLDVYHSRILKRFSTVLVGNRLELGKIPTSFVKHEMIKLVNAVEGRESNSPRDPSCPIP